MTHLLLQHLAFSTLLLILLQCRSASATYVCPSSSGTYVSGSAYEDNLKLLLSAMASRTPIDRTFQSSRGDPPDQVFGIALCSNTSSSAPCSTCADPQCKSCMDAAVADALVSCPNRMASVGVFDSCMLSWNNKKYQSTGSSPPPAPPPETADSPPPPPRRQAPPVVESPPPNGNIIIGGGSTGGGKKSVTAYAVAIPLVVVLGMVVGGLFLWWRKRAGASPSSAATVPTEERKPPIPAVQISQDGQANVFDYQVLRRATNNFSESNLLGRGGFGPVYKGVLPDRQQVAIKKLDTGSIQGIDELNNEVVIVTKLQHKNLVKVLGYCMQEDETMLVYEFIPNTSLDKFLLDAHKCESLTWTIRYKIIKGVSRGLLYLHEDSRLTIIHRDMKTSNILLDQDMNPKISDFGLAKLFEDNRTHANTSRIAGTLGYISPEFLMQGVYSTKSDIYSFGIILLEIVTGRMVHSFSGPGRGLVNYVIQHWNEGRTLQALDPRLQGICIPEEVTTSLYIGLLCCQEDVNSRPDIGTVVGMLSSPPPISRTNMAFR